MTSSKARTRSLASHAILTCRNGPSSPGGELAKHLMADRVVFKRYSDGWRIH